MKPYQSYGHMLQEFYVAKVRELCEQRKARLRNITTREKAEAYVQEVRKKVATSFGALPEKTPLNARATGKIEKAGFAIEKIIFESRPGLPVTGLLYRPEKINGKAPGVLGVCGHSHNGKAENAYQAFCISLALKGFIVFIYDPISQGERWQFLDAPDRVGISGICTREHNMIGKQLRLCDEFFGAWRAWDGIRALDYLLSLPEVDTSRIGVTGNSGGGTLTTYINALDSRPTMAAPGCYITSYQRNLENELPCDTEQIPPGIISSGCEMADLIIARAPRPVIILGKQNDFFDIRGSKEAYKDISHIYSLLGATENVKLFEGPGNHGYTIENREAMYAFFGKHAKVDCDAKEPAAAIPLPEVEILCSPEGQVKNIPGTKLVHDFILDKAAELASARASLDAATLQKKLSAELKITAPANAPYTRSVQRSIILDDNDPNKATSFSNFVLETEPGIMAILKYPDLEGYNQLPQGDLAWLYIPHLSTEAEILDTISQRHLDNARVFGLDVRGSGETMPLTCGRNEHFFTPYGYDFFYASQGIMLDQPYLGGKVYDVLSAIKLLKETGYKEIGLTGRGLGSIVAAFAALLSDDVNEIKLINAPKSYEAMTRRLVTLWPVSHMLPGILKYADLPDIYAALQAKNIKLIEPWDAMFQPIATV